MLNQEQDPRQRTKENWPWYRDRARSLFFFNTVLLGDAWPDRYHDFGITQRRICDFLQYPSWFQKYLCAFRSSAKSTCLEGFMIWDFVWAIAEHRPSSLIYDTATKENAYIRNENIILSLTQSDALHWVFPELPPTKDKYDKMTKNRISIGHQRMDFASMDTTLVSRHYPKWINDDLENDENAETAPMRAKIIRKWRQQKAVLSKQKKSIKSLEIDTGTPFHFQGLNWHIRTKMDSYAKLIIPCYVEDGPQKGQSAWPELYTTEDFENKRKEVGPTIFAAQYFPLRPVAEEDALCKEDWFRYWSILPENRYRTMVIDPGGSIPGVSDPTGLTILDTDENGLRHVVYAEEFWWSPVELIDGVKKYREQFNPDYVAIEKEKYTTTVADSFRHRYADLRISFVEHKGRPKAMRIWRLRQWFETGRLLIHRNQEKLKDQILTWSGKDSQKDNILDSLAYNVEISRVPPKRVVPKFDPQIGKGFDEEIERILGKTQGPRTEQDAYF